MVEKNKQFVIFGDFSKINFENVLNVSFKEKYQLMLVAKEDFQQAPVDQIQPFSISITPPVSRPTLISADRKFSVFFGSKRIHIEEIDTNAQEYELFSKKSKEILSEIISLFSLNVDRAAVNGTITEVDTIYIKKVFSRFLKSSELCKDDMEDWLFRINNKLSESNTKPLNRIVSAQLRKEMLNGLPKNILYFSYDYNTIPNGTLFTEKELNNFFDDGIKYRRMVIDGE